MTARLWGAIGLLLCSSVLAGEVSIIDAKAQRSGEQWRFAVTLKHADSGWDHYADRWRVVDADGRVLGERVLLHPHVHEQPVYPQSGGDCIVTADP